MNRNKFIACFKVLTFINIKIFTIVIFLLASIIIGTKYVKATERERNALICNIRHNEKELMADTELNNKIMKLDNTMLSKSLDRTHNYNNFNEDVELMLDYTSKIKDSATANDLKFVIIQKSKVLKKITNFEASTVNLNKVKTKKQISLVNTNIKNGLFKKKIEHDTITKSYSVINKDKYIEEYDKAVSSNSSRLNSLIKHNNELTIKMKLLIDNYSNKKTLDSFKQNQEIFNKLKENIKLYTTITLILLSLIIIFVYLLLVDIKKIKKANNRSSEAVTMLITTAKELRNEHEK